MWIQMGSLRFPLFYALNNLQIPLKLKINTQFTTNFFNNYL